MELKLKQDYILVKMIEDGEKVTDSGVIIPKKAIKEKCKKGVVLDLGPDVEDETLIGKVIYVHKSAGVQLEDFGHLIREDNIYATLEEDDEEGDE